MADASRGIMRSSPATLSQGAKKNWGDDLPQKAQKASRLWVSAKAVVTILMYPAGRGPVRRIMAGDQGMVSSAPIRG